MLRIDRSILSATEANSLDCALDAARNRRSRNVASGACLNENIRKEHGPATHGRLCLACRENHRGHTLESTYGAERYRQMLRESKRLGVSVIEISRTA